MSLQAKEAALPEEAEEFLGAGYAGIWFDNEKGEFVLPVVSAVSARTLSNDLTTDPGDFRSELVSASWAQLEAAQKLITDGLRNALPPQSATTSLDAKTNSVVVQLSDALSAQQRQKVASLLASAQVPTESELVPASSLQVMDLSCNTVQKACPPPIHGGVWWGFPAGGGETTVHCSVGFTATGNQLGNRFMLTAGHCVVPENEWRAAWAELPLTGHQESREIGPLEDYRSTLNGATTEWAKYKLNGSYWDPGSATPVIAAWGTGENYEILSEGSSYLGQEMCHSGASSGVSCAPVLRTEVAVEAQKFESETPHFYYHETEFGPACGIKGDSGGPVFSGHTAFGMLQGGTNLESGTCNQDLFYPEITQTTEEMGVHIGPRVGTPPIARVPGEVTFNGGNAILHGTVDANGVLTNYHFDYGATAGYGNATLPAAAGEGYQPVAVEQSVPGLDSRATYHYRLVAQNGLGASTTEDQSFTTPAFAPIVSSVSAVPGKLSATFSATVNGRALPTHYHFELGLSPSELNQVVPIPDGESGPGVSTVSQTASGIEGTIYYRLAATNEGGTTFSGIQQVYVQERPTIGSSEGVSHIGESADVTATLNPHGKESTWFVEYGPTTAYGSKTAVQNAGSGTSPVNIGASLSGLNFGQNYHARIVAENWAGVRQGPDVRFTAGVGAYDVTQANKGVGGPEYSSVSCASAVMCVGLGQEGSTPAGGAGEWNGARWTDELVPGGQGTEVTHWAGISCVPGGTTCTAVGYETGNKNTTAERLAERRIGPGNWERQALETPVFEGQSRFYLLTAIDCPTATSCFATGNYGVGNQLSPRPMVERWNGSKWQAEMLPVPAGFANAGTSNVSCVSASSCTAVGETYVNETVPSGLYVERWNGTSWSAEVIPAPSGNLPQAVNHPASISCAAAVCEVAASYRDSSKIRRLFAEQWTGTKWEVQSVPNPEGSQPFFSLEPPAVSCGSATMCELVGTSQESEPGHEVYTYQPDKPYAERWNGTTWEQQVLPRPAAGINHNGWLEAVDCPEATACVATGHAELGEGVPYEERFRGLAEVFLKSPTPTLSPVTVSGIGETSANLTSSFGANWTQAKAWWEYGTTSAYGTKTTELSLSGGSEPPPFTTTLSGLQPGTQYHVRPVITGGGHTVYGQDQTFVTKGEPASLAVDKTVTTHQSSASSSISAPALTTSGPNELLLAFLSSDGPSGGGTESFSGVTGGGLTWHLVRRANAQAGTAEIWAASASSVLTNATVTATRSSGSYVGSITVVALSGADLVAEGASAGGSAASGAPSVSLTTTRGGSWVWGVGDDWDSATARTVGGGQTKVDEYLASGGDTMWVQRQNATAPSAGTAVTLNDTAPTGDRWNLAAVEVLPAVNDTQPPSAPTGLTTAGTVTSSKVPLSWTASTDNQGVAGYRVFRGGTQVGEVAGTSFTDTTVAASTAYTYTVKAFDAAGNVSGPSNQLAVTTPAADTTPPTVMLGAVPPTVSGTINLAATASDASGIAGVQFLVDGSPVGAEDTSSPYELTWNSASVGNGEHKISARAKDGAGNTATSAAVTVTVTNTSSSSLALDGLVTTHQSTPGATISSPSLSTTGSGDLLLAFVSSDGPEGFAQSITGVSGGGLTWTLRGRANSQPGTAEVWQAVAPIPLTNATITATRNLEGYGGAMTVAAFSGADTTVNGAVGSASAASGAASASLVTTKAGSWVWGVGTDWDQAVSRTPGSGQTVVDQFLAANGDTFWTQRQTATTAAAGTSVAISDTAPTGDRWNLAVAEVRATGP